MAAPGESIPLPFLTLFLSLDLLPLPSKQMLQCLHQSLRIRLHLHFRSEFLAAVCVTQASHMPSKHPTPEPHPSHQALVYKDALITQGTPK